MKSKLRMQIILDINTERERQIRVEGWTPAHDDQHDSGELAAAAGFYAMRTVPRFKNLSIMEFWPWDSSWFKPTNQRRDLIKAAALIVAEIERLDRLREKE